MSSKSIETWVWIGAGLLLIVSLLRKRSRSGLGFSPYNTGYTNPWVTGNLLQNVFTDTDPMFSPEMVRHYRAASAARPIYDDPTATCPGGVCGIPPAR